MLVESLAQIVEELRGIDVSHHETLIHYFARHCLEEVGFPHAVVALEREEVFAHFFPSEAHH
jgi:hypothetical protein